MNSPANSPRSILTDPRLTPKVVAFQSVREVEPIGIEPTTSWLQTRRSPD